MRFLWRALTRLFHPITLAVVLVGVAGFLVGLIIAVERQDAALQAQLERVRQSDQTARLQTALAGRESEMAELRTELERLRTAAPPPEALVTAENRIAGLETSLADNRAELEALQQELDKLSGQLAEAIQTRDDMRQKNEKILGDGDALRRRNEELIAARDALREQVAQATRSLDTLRQASEQARSDSEAERARLEQTIADLREDLAATQARMVEPEPAPEEASSAEAPARDDKPAAAPPAPAPIAEPQVAETEEAQPEAKPAAARRGPIAQGIEAYQAGDYAKAYSLWLPPALNGASRAQFYVGALYFEGRGVPKDLVLSYMWLRAATKADDPGAIKLLDRLRQDMSGPELAEAETRIANGERIPPR